MKRTTTWLGAACLSLTLCDCAPVLAEPAPKEVVRRDQALVRPALWKVADEDTTIWLFGTIHILPQEVNWYTGPVAKALDQSGELVTEIPIEENVQSASVIVAASARDDGMALRATLPAEDRAAYDAAMAKLSLPPALFDGNDTWFAALMLTMIPLKLAGYATETGIDAQVAAKARARHLPNTALETATFQIGLFEHLPETTQRAYLNEVVAALPTVKVDIDAMVAAWTAGDADHLAQLLNEDESDPEMRRVLITDRNRTWAKWLKARLDKPGTVFVAVGAGHLAGAGSVQDQLAAAGVRSTRVQ